MPEIPIPAPGVDPVAIEELLRREAAARGITFDISDVYDVVRNASYSVGGIPVEQAIANELRKYDIGAASTSHRIVDSQSAEGQALYGSGADLQPVFRPVPPLPPTIMMSGTQPGGTLLSGELTTTSLPNRPLADAVAFGGGLPFRPIESTQPVVAPGGFPPWLLLAGAGLVLLLLMRK